MGRVEVLGRFILCILIPSVPVVSASTVSCSPESDHVSSQGFSNNELTHYLPIYITANNHFSQLGFPGSGTYEDRTSLRVCRLSAMTDAFSYLTPMFIFESMPVS